MQVQDNLTSARNSTSTQAAAKYYQVKKGDTFGGIAKKHQVSVSQLQKLNPKVSPSKLTIGQRIRVK
jgi:LysM repeat protein